MEGERAEGGVGREREREGEREREREREGERAEGEEGEITSLNGTILVSLAKVTREWSGQGDQRVV